MALSSGMLIEEIIRTAREAGASDVHLAADASPRMRVGGVLSAMGGFRLKSSDMLDILIGMLPEARREKFEEQGEYDYAFSSPVCGRCRVHAYRQRGSVALAVRLISDAIPSPEELGMPDPVTGLCRCRRGLVLVAGPAGSGKSTTVASLIDKINDTREALVITLEKPIEYLHLNKRSIVNQREIGIDSVSFADALTAALREDPDVVAAGSLDSPEAVRAAAAAAETGNRLVIASLDASGPADAVERILDMFPQWEKERIRARLANILEMIVFQRLLPRKDGTGREAVFTVLPADTDLCRLIREGKMPELSDREG